MDDEKRKDEDSSVLIDQRKEAQQIGNFSEASIVIVGKHPKKHSEGENHDA
ncbi:MAG: hypothetical protein NVS4B7_03910 [Ktedonobacteraceae bacterium]